MVQFGRDIHQIRMIADQGLRNRSEQTAEGDNRQGNQGCQAAENQIADQQKRRPSEIPRIEAGQGLITPEVPKKYGKPKQCYTVNNLDEVRATARQWLTIPPVVAEDAQSEMAYSRNCQEYRQYCNLRKNDESHAANPRALIDFGLKLAAFEAVSERRKGEMALGFREFPAIDRFGRVCKAPAEVLLAWL